MAPQKCLIQGEVEVVKEEREGFLSRPPFYYPLGFEMASVKGVISFYLRIQEFVYRTALLDIIEKEREIFFDQDVSLSAVTLPFYEPNHASFDFNTGYSVRITTTAIIEITRDRPRRRLGEGFGWFS